MTERPMRTCSRCGITDDHPRDVIGSVEGSGVEPANFHMDCHAQLGCPTCLRQIAGAHGAQGTELRTHLESLKSLTPDQVDDLNNKENQHG